MHPDILQAFLLSIEVWISAVGPTACSPCFVAISSFCPQETVLFLTRQVWSQGRNRRRFFPLQPRRSVSFPPPGRVCHVKILSWCEWLFVPLFRIEAPGDSFFFCLLPTPGPVIGFWRKILFLRNALPSFVRKSGFAPFFLAPQLGSLARVLLKTSLPCRRVIGPLSLTPSWRRCAAFLFPMTWLHDCLPCLVKNRGPFDVVPRFSPWENLAGKPLPFAWKDFFSRMESSRSLA